MAGSKSDYLENKVLDHVLGKTDYSQPASVFIALYTVAPTDAGGGTEVSGVDYVRTEVVNNTTNFPNAVAGVKSNGTQIVFVQAGGSWGTVVAVGVFDLVTGGNLLYWADLDTPKAVAEDDIVVFDVGSLTFTES